MYQHYATMERRASIFFEISKKNPDFFVLKVSGWGKSDFESYAYLLMSFLALQS